MKLWYLPLEPYEERYTFQLREWTERAIRRRGVPFETILGEADSSAIRASGPLDPVARPLWALAQTRAFLSRLPDVRDGDAVLLHDLFHPGYAALPYALTRIQLTVRLYAQCWAQSFDVYDFTHPLRAWMRPYEQMVDATARRVFVASTELADLYRAAGLTCPCSVIGLPFDSEEVRSRHPGPLPAWATRPRRVLFASRLDPEKNVPFLLDLIREARFDPRFRDAEFAVASGKPNPLVGLPPSDQARVLDFARQGLLTLHAGLAKPDYYRLLASSRVHLHTSLQDWVSFTLLEASAFGTPTLAPCFRSFPEALFSDPRRLYVPWDLADALDRLAVLLSPDGASVAARCGDAAAHHDGTLGRMLDWIAEDA